MSTTMSVALYVTPVTLAETSDAAQEVAWQAANVRMQTYATTATAATTAKACCIPFAHGRAYYRVTAEGVPLYGVVTFPQLFGEVFHYIQYFKHHACVAPWVHIFRMEKYDRDVFLTNYLNDRWARSWSPWCHLPISTSLHARQRYIRRNRRGRLSAEGCLRNLLEPYRTTELPLLLMLRLNEPNLCSTVCGCLCLFLLLTKTRRRVAADSFNHPKPRRCAH